MTDTETRIAFAERQGLKPKSNYCATCRECRNPNCGRCPLCGSILYVDYGSNPTDHNHVHTALMGMSGNEWELFITLLLDKSWEDLQHFQSPSFEAVMKSTAIAILKTPLSTLITCFLEATKGRVK